MSTNASISNSHLTPRFVVMTVSTVTLGVISLVSLQHTIIGSFIGAVLIIGTAMSVMVCLMRYAVQSVQNIRRQNIFSEIFENETNSVLVVRQDHQTIYANEKLKRGTHFFAANDLKTVLVQLTTDPVNTIDRIHHKCGQETEVTEYFTIGDRTIKAQITLGHDGLYIWRFGDYKSTYGQSVDTYDVPIVEFHKDGTLISVNSDFQRYFPVTLKTLKQISSTLEVNKKGSIDLNTIIGPKSFFVQYALSDSDTGVMFLFPVNSVFKSQKLDEQDVFEQIPVALMRLSLGGEILAINACGRATLRYPVSIGQHLRDVFSASSRNFSEWLKAAEAASESMIPEFLRCTGTFEEQVLQAQLTKYSSQGEDFFICNLSDVTELKSLEAQFVQSQKMQAIGQLAGGIAHDFNNLLTAISGHCDLLLLRHGPDDMDFADLMQIHQNANRAAALVGQLLAFSRKQNLQFQSLNMRDTLADLGHLLNRLVGEKVKLKLEHGQNLNPVRADKRQLEQVLMNLVVNARDAMPNGGTVEIQTRSLSLSKPLERKKVIIPPGEYVMISVKDEGVGIRSDQLSKIFDPFFTTKKTGEGTGLGLSTVYGIVKQSGGYIFVESTVQQGTQFDVLLSAPARTSLANKQDKEVAMSPLVVPPKAEGVVLLVEDEAPVRAFASRALQLNGFKVLEADCAEAALELLEDKDLHIDAFVTDVVMPGMDGPTWVAKAQINRPDVQVVFVSGYAEDCLEGNEEAFENAAFLPKPFSLSDLTKTVQSVIN